ncbi:putative peptidoglycan glycosyltransferase FtsW [Candidatus Villigracilis affinis]|uniref:FtsW/RodA/SpoVE family cell cycle protein n=1 Tax=Candidatus Villigracilis affinis TaxID=3140682 RepID=UPI001E1430B6|nr:cell division protein FtsW [Anaerolineales bacterium]
MGTGAFVNGQTYKKPRFTGGFDMPLLVVVVSLVVFGLSMLYSSSWDFSLGAYGDAMYMFNRQLTWLGLGLFAALVLAFFDYHNWRRFVVPAMALTIGLLIVVLLMNEIRFGAKRAILGGSVQPSELAKLVSILYLSVWLYAKRQHLHDISLGLIPLGVILGVVGGLIYQQPDLSAAATVLMLGGLLFFLAGGDLKQIGVLLIVATIAAWFVASISATGQQRVGDFLAGIKDPLQASYHVRRSFEAIVNGGWFGVGLGQSQSKLTGLPVPPTDSVFAVVVEELGWFGAVGLIALYGFLVWRGLVIARRAPDMLGTLLATGLVTWIAIEALVNMAVMVGLLPFAGNALPFISAGGSNLVATLAALGIIFNISRQTGEGTISDDEWRSYSAVVNLRWWNGRRGLSRARRTQRANQSAPES